MGLIHASVVSLLPLLPRPVMRFLSRRYIAGETLEAALGRLQGLAAEGYAGILDILGENVVDEATAREVIGDYREAADAIAELGLEAYVSVKPTHVGLLLSEDLAHDLYLELARHCAELGVFVRVEMEDHTTTDATLRVFERLRGEVENVGIVLQSRLFRTPSDIDALGAGTLSVRMVKGVYLEPAAIAHTEAEPIRRAFCDCARQLFRRGARVSFATHDELLGRELIEICREEGVGTDRYEFQVLLGVCERLWREWRTTGHPVRVYVPFGPEWRAYSTRRLRKNPQILQHVMKDLLRRR